MDVREIVLFVHSEGARCKSLLEHESFDYLVSRLRDFTSVLVVDIARSQKMLDKFKQGFHSVPLMKVLTDSELMTITGDSNILVTLLGLLKNATGSGDQLFETFNNLTHPKLRERLFYTTLQKLTQLDRVFLRSAQCMAHTSCAQVAKPPNAAQVDRYYTSAELVNEIKAAPQRQMLLVVGPNKVLFENLFNEHFPGDQFDEDEVVVVDDPAQKWMNAYNDAPSMRFMTGQFDSDEK
jgi:hypothetical protein